MAPVGCLSFPFGMPSRLRSFFGIQEKSQELTIIFFAYKPERTEDAPACRVASFDFREQRRLWVLGEEVLHRHVKKEPAQSSASPFRGYDDVRLPKLLVISVKAHHAKLFA
jgi:hypothetical protein